MKPELLHILRHSLGLDDNGHGKIYRNYYCDVAGGCADMKELAALGFMQSRHTINDGRDQYFTTTKEGRAKALEGVVYEKLTPSQKRYRRWLDADCGYSFGEWLKIRRKNPLTTVPI